MMEDEVDGLGCIAIAVGVFLLIGFLLWDDHEEQKAYDTHISQTDESRKGDGE